MKRPRLIRLLPDRLKVAAWARLFRPTKKRWHPLFTGAPLSFAPGIRMDLIPGDYISDMIAFTGVYELQLSRRVSRLARLGGTMIDVGANMGYYSLLWASSRAGNKCIAFEASPRNCEIMRRNIKLNGMAPRIELHEMAVSREPGLLSFDVGPSEQTGWGGIALNPSDNTINVSVIRIDSWISESIGSIDFLKIDIEGADTWALFGCEKLLRNRVVKEIWYEQNKPRMRQLGIGDGEAHDFLRSLGYISTPQDEPSQDLVQWRALCENSNS